MVAKSKMYHLFSCSIPIHSSRPDEDAIALKTVCQKENKVVKSTVVQIISSSSGKPEETTSTLETVEIVEAVEIVKTVG